MQTVIGWIGDAAGAVMGWCFSLCGNYGWAILLFTLVTRVLLLPLSVWVHLNGLKMVRLMPEINWLHVNRYGDKDAIAEETAKLYKREKYNPMAGVVPVIVQLIILLGLVEAIRSLIGGAAEKDLTFLGINLGWVPAERGGISIAVPVAAALSALVMCAAQNRSQALQAEQSRLNQVSMLVISVGLSLYLGIFVAAGIGLYWIAGNLLSVAQMYALNAAIPPQKHVDYAELEKSREALREIESLGGEKKGLFAHDENAKREKADYRRFFSIRNKHVVFYSEKSGFWKYFRDTAEELLKQSNVRIHYVTNDPDDQVFRIAEKEPRILPYYIGPKKIITLMMKMDADIVVMTTPDLESFHIKRSYVRKDIEYIYTPHDPMSVHMSFREGAMDHFDTVFCVGPQQVREIRKTEEVYGLPAKTLVEFGYPLLDDLRAEGADALPSEKDGIQRVLIAPSWNEDNILDSCIDGLLERLPAEGRIVTVRPHPEYVKRYGPKLESLMNRWADKTGEGLRFETDFSSNRSMEEADVLITDWSGIAYEYSYARERPTLFINTKMKAPNPNWERIGITPLEIALRDRIGRSLNKDELDRVNGVIAEMTRDPEAWREQIRRVREENIFHPGESGKTGAAYIVRRLTEAAARRAGEEKRGKTDK